jgi:uncharacterized protein (TIGR03083 family)
MVIEAYLSAAGTVAALLRVPELAARWDEPSALPGFRVGGLAGHLARGVFTVEKYLAAAPPDGPPTVDAAGYFLVATDTDPESETNRQIRARGAADAGAGPDDLAGRYDAALARLAGTLPGLDPARPVPMVAGHVLTLADCLVTRMVELLVHADDLAVSLDVEPPAFGDRPAELVIAALARGARRRHGTAPVLRALARRERASGPIAVV